MSGEDDKKLLNIVKKMVYTHCGYGTVEVPTEDKHPVLKEDDFSKLREIVTVNLKSGASLSLPKDLLRTRIKLRLKIFQGSRKIFEVEVGLNDTMERLRELFIEADTEKELQTFFQLKLFYPMGKMTELTGNSNIYDMEIPCDTLLVGYGISEFIWDISTKGDQISIENSGLTVTRLNGDRHQSVLATVGFSSGRQYWEVTIDKIEDEDGIALGVYPINFDLSIAPYNGLEFWEILCGTGEKIALHHSSKYAEGCSPKDTFGMLLEFHEKNASLTFFKNGKSLGVAFSEIPLITLYPGASLGRGTTHVTLNPSAKIPQSTQIDTPNLIYTNIQ